MRIHTEVITVPKAALSLAALRSALPRLENPVRFVVTSSTPRDCTCEVDCISGMAADYGLSETSIFDFTPRRWENAEQFNAALVIPTGIGAQVGGACGDGNAVARLLASACDVLITHPNVVNAADINEMTENTLYVEGSLLTRLLMGQIGLQRVRSNRVLLLMDKHKDRAFNDGAINMAGLARVCGIDCDVMQMPGTSAFNVTYTPSGRAAGEISQAEEIFETVAACRHQYDAIALTTRVEVPLEDERAYYQSETTVNPFGGIEAMLTHGLATAFDIPCAHSPMCLDLTPDSRIFDTIGVIDPRKAADTLSETFLFSILKGLHRAPRVVRGGGLGAEDVSCLVIPDGCIGLPTLAALEQGIPVIAVKENQNLMRNRLEELPFRPGKLFVVENYWEAAGVMVALRAGVAPASVRRPLAPTKVQR